MESKLIAAVVFEVVRRRAPIFVGPLQVGTPLGADGVGLDSIALLELILELEQRTGIRLRDENLTLETLATPGSLIRHLEQARLA